MKTALATLKNYSFLPTRFASTFASNYQQGMLLQLSVLMGTGALAWAILVLWQGKILLSITPLLYIILTLINIVICQSSNHKGMGCNFQIAISILLPFVFQLFMGGLASSGMVMIWSFVAMGGVLTFARGKVLYQWLVYMLVLMVISIASDDIAVKYFENPIDVKSKWFFAINGLLSATTLFFIGLYFVKNQEKVKDLLADANEKLKNANHGLFEKNTDMLKSMRYAETIQQAINPTFEKIETLFPLSFFLQIPKEHVSGDFLWISETEDYKIAACVDCTGHGMPGGLLAMMGTCIINGLVHEKNIVDPDQLLLHMDRIVSERLNQKTNGNMDGMEVAIVSFRNKTSEVKIATAGGSVYLFKKEEEVPERIRLNSSHVGGTVHQPVTEYLVKTISLNRGDRIYLTTDGFIDQFGGTHNKKYSRKKFEKTLVELKNTSIQNQNTILAQNYSRWKGINPQTDDILVFGFEAN